MSRRRKQDGANKPFISKLPKFFAYGAILGALAIFVFQQVKPGEGLAAMTNLPAEAEIEKYVEAWPAEAAFVEADWTVGGLRPDGLRIIPSGLADASRVLDPEQFADPEARRAYKIATEIPEVLNELYCWCGCEDRGVHRSNLGCFEDFMSVNCAVCRGTAEIAYAMAEQGVTDAGEIQAAVDARWAPQTQSAQ